MSCCIFAHPDQDSEFIQYISEYLDMEVVNEIPLSGSFIDLRMNGLHFTKDSTNLSSSLHVDFLSGSMGWRLKRTEHETSIKKAIGKNKEDITIFDGTAGLLSDTIIFLALGHKVVACEQSKIIFLLVNNAIERAKPELPFLKNLLFLNAKSETQYKKTHNIDIVYLDPMYPEPSKNVLRSGDISTINHILDIENIADDGDAVFFNIKNSNFKKIILKRPIKAEIIEKNLNYQVKGKSTRFDIYI
ncbi:class I SAM-dependent methyltransferase [Gammaproteobacteria bacterium]|nr:class I SAM-dependent methyltransferase [Gammaproteobacteria bacterium]